MNQEVLRGGTAQLGAAVQRGARQHVGHVVEPDLGLELGVARQRHRLGGECLLALPAGPAPRAVAVPALPDERGAPAARARLGRARPSGPQLAGHCGPRGFLDGVLLFQGQRSQLVQHALEHSKPRSAAC